jgi:hypothetical protein
MKMNRIEGQDRKRNRSRLRGLPDRVGVGRGLSYNLGCGWRLRSVAARLSALRNAPPSRMVEAAASDTQSNAPDGASSTVDHGCARRTNRLS